MASSQIPINNYCNFELGHYKTQIITSNVYRVSPYTEHCWWCSVDYGQVYRKSDIIFKGIISPCITVYPRTPELMMVYRSYWLDVP